MPIALRWDRQGLITSIKDLSTQEDGLFVATDGVLIRWVSELVVGWISEASLEGLGLYQGGWNSVSDYIDWMTIYLNLCYEQEWETDDLVNCRFMRTLGCFPIFSTCIQTFADIFAYVTPVVKLSWSSETL